MDQDAAPPPQPPFTANLSPAEAKLTEAEHKAYQAQSGKLMRRLAPQSGGWGLWIGGGVLALAGALVAVLLDAVRERNGGTVAVLLFGAYMVGVYATDWRQKRYLSRWTTAQRNAAAVGYGARQYVLDDDGMLFKSEALQGRMPWAAFNGADVSGGLLLLRADRIAQLTAIPVRAFASPEDAARAAEYACRKVAAALGAAGQAG